MIAVQFLMSFSKKYSNWASINSKINNYHVTQCNNQQLAFLFFRLIISQLNTAPVSTYTMSSSWSDDSRARRWISQYRASKLRMNMSRMTQMSTTLLVMCTLPGHSFRHPLSSVRTVGTEIMTVIKTQGSLSANRNTTEMMVRTFQQSSKRQSPLFSTSSSRSITLPSFVLWYQVRIFISFTYTIL